MTDMPPNSEPNPGAWEGKPPRQARPQITDSVLVALLDAIVSGSLRPSEAMALAWSHIRNSRPHRADDAIASRAIALADAALGAEGIAVIDPYARELARWVAEGRMSGDEAVAFITALVDAGANLVDPEGPPDPGYQVAAVPPGVDPPGATKRSAVRKPSPFADPSKNPRPEAGDRADPITAAPGDAGAVEDPSDSHANTLSDRIGPFYDTAGLRGWFQISSEAVDAHVQRGEILAVVSADGSRLFPAFQIDEGGQLLPRLREVLAELDPEEVDPWGDAVWLNAPSDDLDGLTPAAALRTQRADDVIRLAGQAGSFRSG
ncbi:antitoxin VbhA family protein [Curtobacterium sp. MCBA15_012]|uniref:antitoxin VbhA family protein n=1 Tax=Curtobacterium sp. MCBA15_012 TaxID=1898738 RepID=UPI0011146297|nr:antitoxin VbhA family protein [Curtobacterium sp. MCBA15_012]WIB00354.1 antitoxin VbhA family protein [Curtobacterium sp. MCBA15_012]